MRIASLAVVAGTALALLSSTEASAAKLITPAEAALPPATAPKLPALATRSGITRAPGIEMLTPKADGTFASPLPLLIRFVPHGGAKIDPSSVKLTYLKSPPVDLTERIRPFLTPDGIDMKEAELPPGNHALRVELRDSEGRTTTVSFNFTVGK